MDILGKNPINVTSEDSKILTQIQSTHSHDARQVDVQPVLDVIEDIVSRAHLPTFCDLVNINRDETEAVDALMEKMGEVSGGSRNKSSEMYYFFGGRARSLDGTGPALATPLSEVAAGRKGTVLEELAITIQKVCCEFSCKCVAGDAHASAISTLKTLGNYSWDAKVVIALAAFAVSYGELWLVTKLDHINPLARSIAALKQTPERIEINGVLKPMFAALNDLAKLMIDVSKTLIKFRMLPSNYITPEDAPLATSLNLIVNATYWAIRCITACGAQIVNIGITSGLLGSGIEAWDLSSLTHKAKSIQEQLEQRLSICYEFIKEKQKVEAYNYLKMLFSTIQKDNVTNLKALICNNADTKPLMEVSTKNQVQIDVLRGKTVLLFISDLDVTEEELAMMDKMYKESRRSRNESQYEIVWLPIVDKTVVTWTTELEDRFKQLRNNMSWYTLFHPSLLDEVSIKFIKEDWGFAKKHIIVSLNPMGKVETTNALHMILIWGNAAYPFTTVTEEKLWKKQTWELSFVMDSIHPNIPNWIVEPDTHICLFGGEDIEWIRKFTSSMKEHVIQTLGVKLELIYVGKHNTKDAVEKIMSRIKLENLAHTLPDLTHVWYFWSRLEAMLYSKMIHGRNVENDNILKEIMSLMGFDGGDQGWAFIGKGNSDQIVKGKGDIILNIAIKNPHWKDKYEKSGFLGGLSELIKPDPTDCGTPDSHCNKLLLLAIEGAGAPRFVPCADCGRPMEKFIMYRCCTG